VHHQLAAWLAVRCMLVSRR